MVRPTTGQPCCCKRAATVELYTPPLMATATMPDGISARAGRMSNWDDVIIKILFYRIHRGCARTAKFSQGPPWDRWERARAIARQQRERLAGRSKCLRRWCGVPG